MERNPGVKVKLESNDMLTMLEYLRDGLYDMLFIPYVPAAFLDGVRIVRLAKAPAFIVLSQGHPLCQRTGLCPTDCREENFLVAVHDDLRCGIDLLKRYMEPYGVVPRCETRANTYSAMMGVLNGEGVTICSTLSCFSDYPGLQRIPLHGTQSLFLATRSDEKEDLVWELANLTVETLRTRSFPQLERLSKDSASEVESATL